MTINLTNDDGSVVVFLDPAGVQAAVDAAVAAVPAPVSGPVVTPTDTGITVTRDDGTTEDFIPASAVAGSVQPEAELPAA